MTNHRNVVPWIGTVLLVAVIALALTGIMKGTNATPPTPIVGRAFLGFCALAGLGGLYGVWSSRLRRTA